MEAKEARPLRVLIVEDSENDTELLVRALEKGGYDLSWNRVDTAEAMSTALDEPRWDLVLSDANMPQFSAAAALDLLRSRELDLPLVVVSGAIGEEQAVAMMRAGAQDYVSKDNLPRLMPVIERELEDARNRQERRSLERRLVQAQKMEAVGRLAGGIAHDFNNLLTVINGFSSVVLEKLDPEDQVRRDLELVLQAGEKAANLTRQLLAFGRRQVLCPRVLDLNKVVAEFESLIRRTIGEDIEVLMALDPSLAWVKADAGQIEQVLLNLAVNARDAMPDGGKLTIETANRELDESYAQDHPDAEPGSYVMLAVTDSGTGMDEETLSRLFEPFFTTKERGEGTGLGLATSYGIVKQSGGSIRVRSEPGQGTTFEVYLPRARETPEAVEKAVGMTGSEGGSETLLVVEDDEMVRQLAVRALEDRGYSVLTAKGLEQALQVCRDQQSSIDLLVTDLIMPGGTGLELAEQAQRLVPGLKTVYISGYAGKGVLHDRQLQESMEFLEKPFSSSALARKVREVLSQGNA